ncbi:YjcZ family sporulation protein [Bacillus sp. FJAT-29937]|uniref:YjcZ family sporulation protein n=1 Tax=Bacillus sp. FJAT-29937 TaxID=1720553 RepID=UPI00083307E1|nr:YjcZ family sporulation protein [Bacillus sp. FJAT-29937]
MYGSGCGYDPCYPGYGYPVGGAFAGPGYGYPVGGGCGFGGGFALIVVLFILLIIIGASCSFC